MVWNEYSIVEDRVGMASEQGIYLISPSGAVQDPAALTLARQRLATQGFATALDAAALAVHQRFAGTDAERAASIERALVQAYPTVMVTRGGYGLTRLLPAIDWRAVAASGKTFIGFSDFTAFQLALLAQTGASSLTGPAAIADFGGAHIEAQTHDWFVQMLTGKMRKLSFASRASDPVDVRGVLWGGNLAVLVAILGTPYFPQVPGGILFLEDVGEHPYRIERMLVQLWQAGVLSSQNAIVLGHFTQYRLSPADRGYDLDAVVHWLRTTVKIPVVTGLPYGHVALKATLPVGRRVGLVCADGMATLHFDA